MFRSPWRGRERARDNNAMMVNVDYVHPESVTFLLFCITSALELEVLPRE
jgi:hypothetical protein